MLIAELARHHGHNRGYTRQLSRWWKNVAL